jgi:uncharacterized protein (TIGR03437 family)
MPRRSMMACAALSFLAPLLAPISTQAQVPGYTISTAPGSTQTSSRINYFPTGLAFDAAGNLYVAAENLVFKLSAGGALSTIAGGGVNSPTLGDGGPATKASLGQASGLAVDAAGNVYVADSQNNRIRKISTDGTITTVAGPGSTAGILGDGGPATSATLSGPADVAIDSAGNLYIADTNNYRVRKVSTDGTIRTVAGNGSAFDSTFTGFTGDGGAATSAVIGQPVGLAIDGSGSLYIADSYHSTVRKVSASGIISTVAGTGTASYSGDGGLATLATLMTPQKVAVDASGNLYIGDERNYRVRLVTPDGKIVTIAGNGTSQAGNVNGGPATSAALYFPEGIAVGTGGKIYVSEGYSSGRILVLTPTGSQLSPPPTLAETGVESASAFGGFKQVALGGWIEIYGSYLAGDSRLWAGSDFNGINAPTSLDGTSVTIGGVPAFIDYISPGQINAQVPTNLGTGAQNVVVKTAAGTSAPFTVTVNPEEPGLLAPAAFVIKSLSYVAATFADGTFVLPPGAITGLTSRRAQSGDTITLYGVGFGPVSPSIPAGQTVEQANALALPLHVFVDGREAAVSFAGLAPNTIGLYQINMTVPKNSYVNFAELTFTLGGVTGNQSLNLAVQ